MLIIYRPFDIVFPLFAGEARSSREGGHRPYDLGVQERLKQHR